VHQVAVIAVGDGFRGPHRRHGRVSERARAGRAVRSSKSRRRRLHGDRALDPGVLASLAGGDPAATHGVLPMDAASELAMRRLTAIARHRDPEGSLAEHVIGFAASLLARRLPERTGSGRPATAAARRRVVSQAKAALAADPRLGLVELSRVTGCSPHHLSRVFARLTGLTVSQYRNRLRVSLALERVADGEPHLAGLAGDLGFADHAHLTRTVRAATGRTPSSLRRLPRRGVPAFCRWPPLA
jgi:AraC-like DNA-binding protein